jgi:iron complex transport system ATP-binding protein
LLDEPTAHLDLRHVLDLVTLVRAEARGRGAAVLVVVHDLPTAALLADDALLLSGGRAVAFGPADEVLRREALEQLFEVELAPVQVGEVATFLPLRPRPVS